MLDGVLVGSVDFSAKEAFTRSNYIYTAMAEILVTTSETKLQYSLMLHCTTIRL